MSKVLKIKIDRNIAGTEIPYDVVYLFPREQRALISRLWEFALVMPFEDSFKKIIYKLPLSKISHLKQYRDDDNMNLSAIHSGTKVVQAQQSWETLCIEYALDDRIVVVPLLMSKQEKGYKPKYITSRQWFSRLFNPSRTHAKAGRKHVLNITSSVDVSKFEPAISDLAYIVTPFSEPEDIIRPLCSVCPRNLQHLQGQCIPGMPVCYETLNFNLKQPTPVLPIIEEEGIPF